jgi:membrane protein YdbS with pleckstrin-like domain
VTRFLAVPFVLAAAPALAHPGHIAGQAGHSHYVALAAVVLAVIVAGVRITDAVIRWRRRRIAHG